MRIAKLAITISALLLICTATVVGLDGPRAIAMVNDAEEKLPTLLAKSEALMTTGDLTEYADTVDGVLYNVAEFKNPETEETLKRMYDADGNLIKEEYYDPGTGVTLTTVYDATGAVISHKILTINEDETVMESVEIIYDEDGCKTYICIDFTEAVDNKVTIKCCGDINNPDNIKSMTVETQPGMPRPPVPRPPVESTCPNTGQSEIRV